MSTSLFHGLEGQNIYFKPLNTDDAKVIHSYASDENVKRFISWPLMKTLEETHNYIEEMLRRETAGTHLYASVVIKSTQEIIGTAMIFGFDMKRNMQKSAMFFIVNTGVKVMVQKLSL